MSLRLDILLVLEIGMPSGDSTYSEQQEIELLKALPPRMDWRKKRAVGSIRHQGQCGMFILFSILSNQIKLTKDLMRL